MNPIILITKDDVQVKEHTKGDRNNNDQIQEQMKQTTIEKTDKQTIISIVEIPANILNIITTDQTDEYLKHLKMRNNNQIHQHNTCYMF